MTETVILPTGYRLNAFESLDSTNEEAKRQASEGADAGLVVWAKSQSKGRGRQGRTWISPSGGLYFSMLLRPNCAPDQAAQLSFVSALAVAEGIESCLPGDIPRARDITFKWPNDLLIDGRKLSGILLESGGGATQIGWLVVGIGVNVESRPDDTEYPATSLHEQGMSGISANILLGHIVQSFSNWLETWSKDGFESVREAWLERAKGLGEGISVRLPDRSLDGVFKGLTPSGALILEISGEGERIIPAGDVYFPPKT